MLIDLYRSLGNATQTNAEQVSAIFPCHWYFFFSRKQTADVTSIFQRNSINVQKSNNKFAADLAQERVKEWGCPALPSRSRWTSTLICDATSLTLHMQPQPPLLSSYQRVNYPLYKVLAAKVIPLAMLNNTHRDQNGKTHTNTSWNKWNMGLDVNFWYTGWYWFNF